MLRIRATRGDSVYFFFSSRRRHTRFDCDWSSDVCSSDLLRVPPEKPTYTLRRVWLSPEEEKGYYAGFANEGLWPLCHIAHVRPIFRTADWEQYVRVNRRFADVVCEEARTEDPVILVQDYHFALFPRMIRERLPGATIITFWHI